MKYSLLASAARGGLFLCFLFFLCFALVHIARLAFFGWKYNAPKKQQTEEKPPTQKPPAPSSPEPVYYIVEKKRKIRRTKSEYSEPKEFKFK